MSQLAHGYCVTQAQLFRRPIVLYSVAAFRSQDGAALQAVDAMQGVYLPLLCPPAECASRSPLALGYTRGHFSALLPSGASPLNGDAGADVELPVVDPAGDLMPLIFATPGDGAPDALLAAYCDLASSRGRESWAAAGGGRLVAAVQRWAPRTPLEEAMVQEWVASLFEE